MNCQNCGADVTVTLSVGGNSFCRFCQPPVVDLDAHRPGWRNWWAACLACGKAWMACSLAHLSDPTSGFLECPRCHEMRGIRTAPVWETATCGARTVQ